MELFVQNVNLSRICTLLKQIGIISSLKSFLYNAVSSYMTSDMISILGVLLHFVVVHGYTD